MGAESDEDAPPAERRRLWLAILCTGALTGVLSVAFHAGLNGALALRERLTETLRPSGPAGALALMAACAAAVALAVWLTQRFAPPAGGSGIQRVEGVQRGLFPMWPVRVIAVKFAGGILGIGAGLVLGREGPTVQMAATIGHRIGERLRLSPPSRRILLVVGAGAGLAGAFNAPLAGTLFVAEELRAPFHPAIYLGTLLAAGVADLCLRATIGPQAELSLAGVIAPPVDALVAAALVGALAGAAGALFNASLLRTMAAADVWRRRWPAWWLGLLLGAVLGGVAWFAPSLPGGGVTYAARALDGSVSFRDALWLLPASVALTLASYSIGAPGGIFAPLLVIGAALGLVCHGAWLAVAATSAAGAPLLACAGMAGLFAGIVRSPFTGAVLLVEMTGSYALALPLVFASLAAYFAAEALGSPPIYESLLELELRNEWVE